MDNSLEMIADNGQIIYASEINDFEMMIFGIMGMEPDSYVVQVFPEERPSEGSTLAEVAPLHQKFYSTWDDAHGAASRALLLIDVGMFEYNPPVLPAGSDQKF